MGDPVKGVLDILNKAGKVVISLDPATADIRLSDGDGIVHSRIAVNPRGLSIMTAKNEEVVRIDCHDQQLFIGGNGSDGQLVLRDKNGEGQVTIAADEGGFSAGGSLRFQQVDGFAFLRLGGGTRHGKLLLRKNDGTPTVTLDGQAGDVHIENADCAEDFDVAHDADVEPGMVVVLDEDGRVRPCQEAYDGRVAGVISGAGGFRPGLVLDRRRRDSAHSTVALIGKVYCRVDADVAPVRAGALLTTSSRVGHAQVASDRARAFGAVLGKALASLNRGIGLVPVLVTLQ